MNRNNGWPWSTPFPPFTYPVVILVPPGHMQPFNIGPSNYQTAHQYHPSSGPTRNARQDRRLMGAPYPNTNNYLNHPFSIHPMMGADNDAGAGGAWPPPSGNTTWPTPTSPYYGDYAGPSMTRGDMGTSVYEVPIRSMLISQSILQHFIILCRSRNDRDFKHPYWTHSGTADTGTIATCINIVISDFYTPFPQGSSRTLPETLAD